MKRDKIALADWPFNEKERGSRTSARKHKEACYLVLGDQIACWPSGSCKQCCTQLPTVLSFKNMTVSEHCLREQIEYCPEEPTTEHISILQMFIKKPEKNKRHSRRFHLFHRHLQSNWNSHRMESRMEKVTTSLKQSIKRRIKSKIQTEIIRDKEGRWEMGIIANHSWNFSAYC